MSAVTVSLSISADEYVRLYQGAARSVLARTIEGRTIRFPANILQPFVTRSGIEGVFNIYFDSDNRFVKVEPI